MRPRLGLLRPLLWALALASFAAAARAQNECLPATPNDACEAEETQVECPVGVISSYTVPEGVQALRIMAAGGEGGDPAPVPDTDGVGGLGAVTRGIVAVEELEDDLLRVLVGTQGVGGTVGLGGGGGGGSFVGVGTTDDAFSPANLLMVAGGGGGGSLFWDGGAGGTLDGGAGVGPIGGGGGDADGDGGAAGTNAGEGGGAEVDGESGEGSLSYEAGAGGGGAGGDGGDNLPLGEASAFGGRAASNGGAGGEGNDSEGGGSGGFGGGGGASLGGGGGGGYAGGGGGGFDAKFGGGGGGGSSFFDDERVFDTSVDATNEGDGFVVICEIPADQIDLAIEKAATVETDGTTVTFDLEVENLGPEDAVEVVVIDELPACVAFTEDDCGGTATGGDWTWAVGELAENETASCALTVDAADCAGAGERTNRAEVSSEAQDDPNLENNEAEAVFSIDESSAQPDISIEKSGSGPDPLTVGATVEYTFVVTNTGNVTLTEVTVTDPLPGLSPIDCPGTTLTPAAEMTCTATYEVTEADVDAELVENTATVTGEPTNGGPPPTDESTATVPPAGPVPALSLPAFVLLLALLATVTLWTLRRARASGRRVV